MQNIEDFNILTSRYDPSINFSKPHADGGLIEARFVQRVPERFITYISSMSGCDKACRFCHLTQTGQTTSTHLSRKAMLEQAEQVLNYSVYPEAKTVHYNFMARGEPMSNPNVDRHLFRHLKQLAENKQLTPRIKISSIIPKDFHPEDPHVLWDKQGPAIDFYYSLYSTDDNWRKRWIPKAKLPIEAFKWLKTWQDVTGNRVILHWALIHDENDSIENAMNIANMANQSGIKWDFNLVRYNPANNKSRESSQENIDNFLNVLRKEIPLGNRVKIIQRIGYDVKASCGMFLTQDVAA